MIAGANDDGICLFDFLHRTSLPTIKTRIGAFLMSNFEKGNHPFFEKLEEELGEYFAGTRQGFLLPLQLCGSSFQVEVWRTLQTIPYGSISTYLKQAQGLGNEKAVRAIATANGMNGLAILIPCHRVVGTNGVLTGYSGGLAAKKWLLEHERKNAGLSMQTSLF